jgi:hypothetical protein
MDFLIIQAKIWLLGFIWENFYWSFWKAIYLWAIQSPIHIVMAIVVGFCLFAISFMAYSTLRRMRDDGSFAALRPSHKLLLIFIMFAPPLMPAVHAYIFDILIMRFVFVTIFARVKPWLQDWKVWSASWTFSRWVWLFKDRTPGAKWWHQLLHAIEPHGH